jgi:CheY-like chemotaxis protein
MKKKIPILVIDDEIRALELLKPSLEEYGFAVAVASSGRQAIEMAVVSPPRAIILDVCMPGMDGWETLRNLKTFYRTRDIPIAFLTAYSQASDEQKAKAIGARLFLTKPIDPEVLAAKIRDMVAKKPLKKQSVQTTE